MAFDGSKTIHGRPLIGTTNMPLTAKERGVVVSSDGAGDLLFSAEGVRVADEFHKLDVTPIRIAWTDVTELKLLPPAKGAILARIGYFLINIILSNVWAAEASRLAYRLEIRQLAGTTVSELHLRQRERHELMNLVAWINDQLSQGADLSLLESGRPFWRKGT